MKLRSMHESISVLFYHVSCSWSGQNVSGMAVIEVGFPSGYVADYENQLTDLVKRVETQNNKLVLYLDEVKYIIVAEEQFL